MIFLDFARRWRLAFAFAAAANLWLILFNSPLLAAPLLTACLLFDINRGWVKVLRHLPLGAASITTSVWAAGILLPLTHLPLSALWIKIGWEVPDMFYLLARGDPWFRILHDSWIGMGASSLIVAMAGLYSRRAESGAVSRLWTRFLNAASGLLLPVAMYVLIRSPRRSYHMELDDWVLVALVPVAMVLAWWAMLRHVKAAFSRAGKVVPQQEITSSAALAAQAPGGMSMLLRTLLGRQAALLIFLAAGTGLLMLVCHGGLANLRAAAQKHHGDLLFTSVVGLAAAMIPAMLSEVWSLRMLRVLPVSSTTLTGLLLAVPMLLGALAAGLCQVWLLVCLVEPAMSAAVLLALGLGLAGFGALLIATSLHLPARWRLSVLAVLPLSIHFLIQNDFRTHALAYCTGGMVALVAAFAVIRWGLGRTAVFYRARLQESRGR